MEFIGFLSDFTLKDWFSYIFALVIAIAVVIYQKYSNRKAERNVEDLSLFVSRYKEKDMMEESLKGLKIQQINIEKQIKEYIPQLAKESVLKEQLELHAEAVNFHYKEWDKINKELDENSTDIIIEKELKDKIVEMITPKYELMKRLDELKTRIIFSSIIIAITSMFIISPLDTFIAIPFLFFLFKGLYDYLKLKGISEKSLKEDLSFIYNSIYYVIFGIIIIVLIFCGIFLVEYFLQNSLNNSINIVYVILGFLIVLLIILFNMIKDKDNFLIELENFIRKNFNIINQ